MVTSGKSRPRNGRELGTLEHTNSNHTKLRLTTACPGRDTDHAGVGILILYRPAPSARVASASSVNTTSGKVQLRLGQQCRAADVVSDDSSVVRGTSHGHAMRSNATDGDQRSERMET